MTTPSVAPFIAKGAPAGHAPLAPFVRLSTLWIQITGTWCNLECRHCINASGPRAPWLKPLDVETIRRAIAEAEEVGVKEIYFTGGEPFLHGEILPLLELALRVAPTTVLTNGTLIGPQQADALAAMAARAPYSLEIRVSLDDTDREKNDRIRGEGTWAKALEAVRLLRARGLLPIVTATEITRGEHPAGSGMYERFREFLRGEGIERPRVKIMPVFGLGRQPAGATAALTEEDLEGFDRSVLQCADARVVAAGGVYACPILAGLAGARLSTGSLRESFKPAPLYHPACVTCRDTGMTCRNS
jgi:MoaA/NifB/PqqE/SkfB family radical SAM enzyme